MCCGTHASAKESMYVVECDELVCCARIVCEWCDTLDVRGVIVRWKVMRQDSMHDVFFLKSNE
jgi:hypothetical protein